MAGSLCVALYDYKAQDPDELTISKNQQLTVVNDQGTWWLVRNDSGREGLVPCNYIKEQPMAAAGGGGGGGVRHAPAEQLGMYQQTDLYKPPSDKPSLNIKAIAKYRYASTREDELAIEKGDEIIVLEKEADGWWRGRCGERIGWFPFNYVEEISSLSSSEPNNRLPLQQQQPPPMMGGGGVMQMAPQPPPQSQIPQKQFICGVIALYSFNSGNQEELVFTKGELLDIIDQPPDDPDWWEARKADGTTGLIPRNYVEVVHDAQPVSGIGGGGAIGKPPMISGGGAMGGAQAMGGATPPPFANEMWYHGRITRKEADRILSSAGDNGQFLVRESETKVRISLCICTCKLYVYM